MGTFSTVTDSKLDCCNSLQGILKYRLISDKSYTGKSECSCLCVHRNPDTPPCAPNLSYQITSSASSPQCIHHKLVYYLPTMPFKPLNPLHSPAIPHPTAQNYLFFIILFSISASSLHFPQFLQWLFNLDGVNPWTESRKNSASLLTSISACPSKNPPAPSHMPSLLQHFTWTENRISQTISSPGTAPTLSHDYHNAPNISTVASSCLLALHSWAAI